MRKLRLAEDELTFFYSKSQEPCTTPIAFLRVRTFGSHYFNFFLTERKILIGKMTISHNEGDPMFIEPERRASSQAPLGHPVTYV